MRKRLRFFTAISFMLAALFALALTPVWADSVEEKIKALENELSSLKAQQVEIKRDARAQAAAAPTGMFDLSYRPGRGMRVRGTDRSWEMTLGYEAHGQMSFFPGSAKAVEDDTSGSGPSQGALVVRHNELGFNFQWLDGLYEAGTTIRFDSSPPRSKSEDLTLHLEKFSEFYPRVEWVHTSRRPIFDPVYNSSSTSGTTLDRAFVNDSLYSTASTKGIGLIWEDVPLGMGDITFGVVYGTGEDFDSKTASNSNDQRSLGTGFNARPFRSMKDSPLAGWSMGYGFIRDHTDSNKGADYVNIEVGPSANGVEVFRLTTRGANWNHAVWTQYSQGPIRFGASYNWHKLERKFGGDAGGAGCGGCPADGDFGDTKFNTLLLRTGLFVWGPNGFLTGDENGGLMVAFNHFRNYFDAGRGFSLDAGSEDNNFPSMRRYNIIQNIGLLRYFYRPNIIYALEYQNSLISKMRGGSSSAEEARRRLGIRESGGTAQTVTLAVKMNF